MKKDLKILEQCILFKNANNINEMLDCLNAKEKNYKKGEYIITDGDVIDSIFVVIEGSVEISFYDYFGNKNILTQIGQGDIFAETFCCANNNISKVNAIATDKVSIIQINITKILNNCSNCCEHHNQLVYNLLNIMANKNLMLNDKLINITKRSTKEKILSFLSNKSKQANSNTFNITFNRQQMADYLAIDRSAMCSELSKLKKQGILDYNKNTFTLK